MLASVGHSKSGAWVAVHSRAGRAAGDIGVIGEGLRIPQAECHRRECGCYASARLVRYPWKVWRIE